MKKRLLHVVPAAFVALLLGSCELVIEFVDEFAGGGGDGAATRSFNAFDLVTGDHYKVAASLKAAGDKCLVYVDTEESDRVGSTLAQSIAAEFDARIYAAIRSSFGSESDVDENGKVILLLLDIRDGAAGSNNYVAGYFDATDLYGKDTYEVSNEADMIYLDVSPGLPGNAGFYRTIAHEFQHLINFWTTVSDNNTKQDVWINEGLSSAAEYLYAGAHVQEKIDWYNLAPARPGYSDIQNGNNFFVWGENDAYIVDEYATVYLFFQWLRIHAENGSGIYRDILNNPDKHRDYRAVTSAAAARIDPSLSDWGALLRTWLGANVLNVADKNGSLGLYGYGGEIVTSPALASGNVALSPGEGVNFDFTTSFTQANGTNIRYAGFTVGASPAVDLDGNDYNGNYGIVFNVNTAKAGAAEAGVAAGVSSSTTVSSLRASIRSGDLKPPSAYPISVILQPGGAFHPDSHRPAGSAAPSRELDASARILGSRR